MKTIASILLFLLVKPALFGSGPSLYQWAQTGYVTFAVGPGWDGSVTPGTPFAATMLLRTSSSQSYPPNTAEARYTDVLVSASVSFGDYTFAFSEPYPGFAPTIQVLNNDNLGVPVDGYGWGWETPVSQYGIVSPFFEGFLLSTDLSLITSPDYNIQEFAMSRFNRQISGQLDGYDSLNNYKGMGYSLTAYSITAVPEPGVGPICVGLAVSIAMMRWHRLMLLLGLGGLGRLVHLSRAAKRVR